MGADYVVESTGVFTTVDTVSQNVDKALRNMIIQCVKLVMADGRNILSVAVASRFVHHCGQGESAQSSKY